MNKVLSYIDLAKKEGGKILLGGNRIEPDGRCATGYFIEPTIITGLEHLCRTNQEEIFGPVISALPYENLDELIDRANKSEYGLAAGIWTRDVVNAHYIANNLRAGTVWVNCYNVFDAASPFGGYKQSGIGREMGSYALDNYTEVKSVWISMQ